MTPEYLVDRQQIVDLTYLYAWSLDSGDVALLDGVFTDDATANLLGSELVGREAIRARLKNAIDRLDGTQHVATNHMVTIDGDRGTCRWYLQAQHVRVAAGYPPNYIIAGWYEDQLVRTAEGWRVTRRELTVVWQEGNPAVIQR